MQKDQDKKIGSSGSGTRKEQYLKGDKKHKKEKYDKDKGYFKSSKKDHKRRKAKVEKKGQEEE